MNSSMVETRIINIMEMLSHLKRVDFSGMNEANALKRIFLADKLARYASRNLSKTHNKDLIKKMNGVLVDSDIFVVGNCWRIPNQHVDIVYRIRNLLSKIDPLL